MLARIFRYLKALFLGKLDQLEDPRVLLQQAVRDMKEGLADNRQRGIEAITAKNNLKAMVADTERRIAKCDALAEQALKAGKRDVATQAMREKIPLQQGLLSMQDQLAQAEQMAEKIKGLIRRQEEQIRQRTAQKILLTAKWNQARIQIEMDKALNGMSFDEESSAWGRAAEQIQTAESEAKARAELSGESIQGAIAQLEDAQVDTDADAALAELEQRMGLGGTTTEADQTVQVRQQ